MTMHRAKGMEFTQVVLADVGHRSDAEAARLPECQSGRLAVPGTEVVDAVGWWMPAERGVGSVMVVAV